MRDVIVVGAGPSGSETARELAERGWDVALYEKRQEIGAPKRCGEGLSSESMDELGLDIPDRCKRQPIRGALVYPPSMNLVEIDFENTAGWVLERKMFDKWMAEKAARTGAEVRAKTRIKDLLPNNKGVEGEMEGEPFDEEAEVVVAADGVESTIARKAGIKDSLNLEIADSGYQYEMAGLDLKNPHKLKLYFGNEIAPRGYIWVFPKGDRTANVGIGLLGNDRGTAKEYLDRFIKEHKSLSNASILEVNSGIIPLGGFLNNMVADNCLAVGDAGNQVNPIHGGGIAEGIKGAKIAADIIHEGLEEGDTSRGKLREYNERWWSERGKKLKKVEKLKNVVEELDDEDLDYLSRKLGGEDLLQFSKGRNLSRLGKLLLKRPKMIKAARKLI